MTDKVIEVSNLEKKFDKTIALKKVDFSVERGEVVGLLGANGAGKSTLLQILSTLIIPSSGEAKVLGKNVQSDPLYVKKHIGLLFGNDTGLYHRLTAYENISYFAEFFGVPQSIYDQRIKDWAERLQLTPHLHKPAGALSKGNHQKTAIIRTLIHDPDIIFFDEPTTGLDISASLSFQDLLKDLKAEGKTIIFSTHIMEEVEALCSQVIILQSGIVSFQGTLTKLYETMQTNNLTEVMRKVIGG
ncbi:ABC transporter ATP-binding protein [Thermoflavimicrobium daqui]|uniref:ABC transporter ATP-binding protein n=1 Tax=Thermoflavimicrobium daqui TaxID=2137476 RepID=A0A364K332_9BACL|nr:ATP-binding cassette domain-containing protein [Thermoflavimicrobium daqui]RAL23251.1 ABC transporter ATP-binding protein [Thermoflavimicrobium daqui]